MFMSENICTMVDIFDEEVAEGQVITVETRSQGDDR